MSTQIQADGVLDRNAGPVVSIETKPTTRNNMGVGKGCISAALL